LLPKKQHDKEWYGSKHFFRTVDERWICCSSETTWTVDNVPNTALDLFLSFARSPRWMSPLEEFLSLVVCCCGPAQKDEEVELLMCVDDERCGTTDVLWAISGFSVCFRWLTKGLVVAVTLLHSTLSPKKNPNYLEEIWHKELRSFPLRLDST